MPKPVDRLPPLELLAAFEAAARHLSFARAAGERFLTPSALGRQIQALEADVGTPLFTRAHRRIELTEHGRVLQAACHDALKQIRAAVGTIRTPATRAAVAVTTTPGFASLWLLPRLPAFTAAHPGIDVRIDATLQRRELDDGDLDLAIRYAPRTSRTGRRLFDETVQPVCSPAVAGTLATVADLRRHTRLEVTHLSDAGRHTDWDDWSQRTGAAPPEPRAILGFSSYGDAVAAALHGQGVVLGRDPLVRDALASRHLVAPFDHAVPSGRAYFLVAPATARKRPEVRAFADWVHDAAQRSVTS